MWIHFQLGSVLKQTHWFSPSDIYWRLRRVELKSSFLRCPYFLCSRNLQLPYRIIIVICDWGLSSGWPQFFLDLSSTCVLFLGDLTNHPFPPRTFPPLCTVPLFIDNGLRIDYSPFANRILQLDQLKSEVKPTPTKRSILFLLQFWSSF